MHESTLTRALGICGLVAPLALGCGSRSGIVCSDADCELSASSDGGTGGSGGSPVGSGGARVGMGGSGIIGEPARPDPPDVTDDPVAVTSGRCRDDGRHEGSLTIRYSADLARLEGCSVVDGSLSIIDLNTDDLAEAATLSTVTGALRLGFRGTLDGLENLRSVGSLELISLEVPALGPLRGLSEVTTGRLTISALEGATDLRGLGGVAWSEIAIDSAGSLESLRGLSVQPELRQLGITNSPELRSLVGLAGLGRADQILLSGLTVTSLEGFTGLTQVGLLMLDALPRLTDLTPLTNLEEVGELIISGIGAVNLSGLERLRQADIVLIQNNPNLFDADGLAFVQQMGTFTAEGNESLQRLPGFSIASRHMQVVNVEGNPSLASGPAFDIDSIGTLAIGNNAALTRIDGFPLLERASVVNILSNPSLTSVDLSSIESIDALLIQCNASLPESSVEPLRGLTTNQADISGNLGSPVPCVL
jgi:hypothetical protein